jgi:hypothetical protein
MCVMMALLTFLPKGGYPLLTTNTTLSQLGKPAPTLVGVMAVTSITWMDNTWEMLGRSECL